MRKRGGCWAELFLVLALVCLLGGIDARAEAVRGIDVSHYNGPVDWQKVRNQGYSFAMLKTGDGRELGNFADDMDEAFERNYQEARACGLLVGVYHVSYADTVEKAREEAEYCLKILNGRELDLPVAFDMERPENFKRGKSNATAMAKAFTAEMKKAGYQSMLYSSSYNLKTYFDLKKLSGVKIWVAEYGVSKPNIPNRWNFWQYTDSGDVTGANTDAGKCDLNLFRPDAKKIILNVKSLSLGEGESFSLKAKISPQGTGEKLSYSSSRKSVLTVSGKGKLKARRPGTARVTVKSETGKKAVLRVKVQKAPSKISFTRKNISLKKGKSYQTKVRLPKGSYSRKRTYTSSKKSVAVVNQQGVVTARKKGSAVITVKTYNGKRGTLKIRVR